MRLLVTLALLFALSLPSFCSDTETFYIVVKDIRGDSALIEPIHPVYIWVQGDTAGLAPGQGMTCEVNKAADKIRSANATVLEYDVKCGDHKFKFRKIFFDDKVLPPKKK
jgi:hypothetical protein